MLAPCWSNPSACKSKGRGPWAIEKRSPYVRDLCFEEDRLQILKGNGPRVMAALRNIALNLLRLCGAPNIAKALRACRRSRRLALSLLGY